MGGLGLKVSGGLGLKVSGWAGALQRGSSLDGLGQVRKPPMGSKMREMYYHLDSRLLMLNSASFGATPSLVSQAHQRRYIA